MTPENGNGSNGWPAHAMYVLKELERGHTERKRLIDTVNELRTELAMLKVRAGLWGAIAGAIPSAVAVVVFLLK